MKGEKPAMPYLDRQAPLEDRLDDLMSRMTLGEMMAQITGTGNWHGLTPITYAWSLSRTADNKRLGIPGVCFTDGPRGVNVGRSTCFPVSPARAATWDRALEQRVGLAMGLEAKSQGANASGAVCVNILRHPGWGRAQECYGADPFLAGEMGAAITRGLAENVMPVVKHFAANSIENSRFKVSAEMDERTLHEVYLPHFKKCVEAGAAGVMSAYNRVNGAYCGENGHLLTRILKEQWGFDGFVMSDFFLGVRDCARSLKAGLDLEMPAPIHYNPVVLRYRLWKGDICKQDIERAARRVLRKKFQWGLIGPQPPGIGPGGKAAPPAHRGLALEAAQKGLVLLRSTEKALPLDRGRMRRIAVLGPLADKPLLGSPGSTTVNPPYSVTILQGLRNHAGSCPVDYCKNDVKRAALADAVVVVAGIRPLDEGEYFPLLCGGDRSALELDRGQERLILEAAQACKKVVVVLTGGSAIAAGSWAARVSAILMAWYPGMEGGNAVAQALFGDINPSGKLPMTFPVRTGQLPVLDVTARRATYDYWHDYRYFDKNDLQPLFCFGHGLSYTTFAYSNLRILPWPGREKEGFTVRADIANTGQRPGREVVQVYVGLENSRVTPRSIKELKGFGEASLKPGESASVEIPISWKDLAYYDLQARQWKVEKMAYTVLVGASSQDIRLRGSIPAPRGDSSLRSE